MPGNMSPTLLIPTCLFLVSKQDMRITDSHTGRDMGFSSVPTGEMPTPLLTWVPLCQPEHILPHRKLVFDPLDLLSESFLPHTA